MKKLSLFALAAAGLFFAACSSDDSVADEQFNQYDLIEGQSAWISVGIALPGEPTTRANEDLNDGVAAEYEVKDAVLVLFKGANEDDAELVKEYNITATWAEETGDQVPGHGTNSDVAGEVSRTSTKIVQEIESPNLGATDNLYGYVILNAKDNLTISYTAGTKFSAFKKNVFKAIGIANESKGFGAIGTAGLVMTSVPISNLPGGTSDPVGAEVTTLAKIDKSAIYPTQAAAVAGTSAACIYVERAAVKVQVEVASTAAQIELPSESLVLVKVEGDELTGKNPSTEGWYEFNGVLSTDTEVQAEKAYYKTAVGTKLDYTFDGWALGNVNYGGAAGAGYYNTRQFNTDWLSYFNEVTANATSYYKYRMVGETNFFATGHAVAYRTYFGEDVNFSGSAGLLNAQLTDAQYTLPVTGTNYTYTYENTFDENSQIWKNTTYVGVKATIAGGDFYTIEGQPNTRLLETDLPSVVAANHNDVISAARTAIIQAITADLGKAKAESILNSGRADDAQIKNVSFSIVPAVTFGERGTDGSVAYTFKLTLDNVKVLVGDATTYAEATDADKTALNTLVATTLNTENNGVAKIYKFVGGVTYYSTRIAHFGDVETKWSAPAAAYNDYAKIYPLNGQSIHETPIVYGADRANAWLGRWGIVRNNWYKLTIDAINGLGSPVPEDYSGEAGNTPDDNPEPSYFIAAHIHILPWAVRNQSVTF